MLGKGRFDSPIKSKKDSFKTTQNNLAVPVKCKKKYILTHRYFVFRLEPSYLDYLQFNS